MSLADQYPLLAAIESPADLRRLPESQLEPLVRELREFLVHTVSQMGGHFAAGLGTVELTVALHYVYDTPHDRLVWDVGHQAYPHKVLTGRRDRLQTIKLKDGLAPFPSRAESEYDTFGVGHASTSIGAALGMALAAARAGESRRVVAVIGDGAISGGQAFEAMNHAGPLDPDMLVVLNDNKMSISENVGALALYFARVLSGPTYTALRERGKRILNRLPAMKRFARRSEEHMKGMVLPGHALRGTRLQLQRPDRRPRRGRARREAQAPARAPGAAVAARRDPEGQGLRARGSRPDQVARPGPVRSRPAARSSRKRASGPSYSQVFGQWLCDMAERDPRVVGITPAMREGSGLVEFSKRFPDRYYDVAIAEQHAVTLAAGMACEGTRPVVAIYSTFLQRGYDQLIHDVALQNLPVTFAIDRGGLVGGDGATHQGRST